MSASAWPPRVWAGGDHGACRGLRTRGKPLATWGPVRSKRRPAAHSHQPLVPSCPPPPIALGGSAQSHPAPMRPAVSPHERSRGAQARRRHAGTQAAGWRGRSSRRSRGRTRRLQPGFAPRAPRFAGNAFIVLQTYLTRLRSRSFHIKAQMSWASEHLVRFPRGRLARG